MIPWREIPAIVKALGEYELRACKIFEQYQLKGYGRWASHAIIASIGARKIVQVLYELEKHWRHLSDELPFSTTVMGVGETDRFFSRLYEEVLCQPQPSWMRR